MMTSTSQPVLARLVKVRLEAAAGRASDGDSRAAAEGAGCGEKVGEPVERRKAVSESKVPCSAAGSTSSELHGQSGLNLTNATGASSRGSPDRPPRTRLAEALVNAFKSSAPAVFSGIVNDWPALQRQWSPRELSARFGHVETAARFHPRGLRRTVKETECEHRRISIGDFCNWAAGGSRSASSDASSVGSTEGQPLSGGGSRTPFQGPVCSSVVVGSSAGAGAGAMSSSDSLRLPGNGAGSDPQAPLEFGAHSRSRVSDEFSRSEWCGYLDYKHLSQLLERPEDRAAAAACLDWSVFSQAVQTCWPGVESCDRATLAVSSAQSIQHADPPQLATGDGRFHSQHSAREGNSVGRTSHDGSPGRCSSFAESDSLDSTLWIGTEGAHTGCHYDTYGSVNVVVQLFGAKKWILFPPDQTEFLYASRLPFEESSVWAGVDVFQPDMDRCPLYGHARGYSVILEPGDVLIVPRHYWYKTLWDASNAALDTRCIIPFAPPTPTAFRACASLWDLKRFLCSHIIVVVFDDLRLSDAGMPS